MNTSVIFDLNPGGRNEPPLQLGPSNLNLGGTAPLVLAPVPPSVVPPVLRLRLAPVPGPVSELRAPIVLRPPPEPGLGLVLAPFSLSPIALSNGNLPLRLPNDPQMQPSLYTLRPDELAIISELGKGDGFRMAANGSLLLEVIPDGKGGYIFTSLQVLKVGRSYILAQGAKLEISNRGTVHGWWSASLPRGVVDLAEVEWTRVQGHDAARRFTSATIINPNSGKLRGIETVQNLSYDYQVMSTIADAVKDGRSLNSPPAEIPFYFEEDYTPGVVRVSGSEQRRPQPVAFRGELVRYQWTLEPYVVGNFPRSTGATWSNKDHIILATVGSTGDSNGRNFVKAQVVDRNNHNLVYANLSPEALMTLIDSGSFYAPYRAALQGGAQAQAQTPAPTFQL